MRTGFVELLKRKPGGYLTAVYVCLVGGIERAEPGCPVG